MWVPFWFEGNMAWGRVAGPAEWARICAAYASSGPEFLKGARLCPQKGPAHPESIPNFGLYGEHTGPETLGVWASDNGMFEHLFAPTAPVQEP